MESYHETLEETFPLKVRQDKLKQLNKLNEDYVGLVINMDGYISLYNCSKHKTVATLLYYMRKRMKVNNVQSIVCMIKQGDNDEYIMPISTEKLGDLYERYKDTEDGYLHMTMACENVFG